MFLFLRGSREVGLQILFRIDDNKIYYCSYVVLEMCFGCSEMIGVAFRK